MENIEDEIKNDQELYSYFRDRNTTLCRDNFSFLMQHPEVKRLLNDYLSNILLHKPDDVFKFTKDYFKVISDKGESHKFIIFVGPTCVGKTVLIQKLMEAYPDDFEMPRYSCASENEVDPKYEKISNVEFSELIQQGKFIHYYRDQIKNEFIGLKQEEVEKIQAKGKIAVLETSLEEAKKIKKMGIEANFIGILPPSLEDLRARIKEALKKKTLETNMMLETAKKEITEIEKHTFFCFRIVNDLLDVGFNDVKNAVTSLYPFLKYSKEDLDEIKNTDYAEDFKGKKEGENVSDFNANN